MVACVISGSQKCIDCIVTDPGAPVPSREFSELFVRLFEQLHAFPGILTSKYGSPSRVN